MEKKNAGTLKPRRRSERKAKNEHARRGSSLLVLQKSDGNGQRQREKGKRGSRSSGGIPFGYQAWNTTPSRCGDKGSNGEGVKEGESSKKERSVGEQFGSRTILPGGQEKRNVDQGGPSACGKRK